MFFPPLSPPILKESKINIFKFLNNKVTTIYIKSVKEDTFFFFEYLLICLKKTFSEKICHCPILSHAIPQVRFVLYSSIHVHTHTPFFIFYNMFSYMSLISSDNCIGSTTFGGFTDC